MALRRVLSLWETVMLGVGVIVGAGIYSLVGVAGVHAGGSLWLAFLAAGLLAGLTALTYAELSTRFPRAGSSFQYVRHAFQRPALSFLSGWLVAAAGIIAAATVSLAFGQYTFGLTGWPPIWAAAGLLAAVGLLNTLSLSATSRFNSVATLLEVAGLAAILVLAIAFRPEQFFQLSFAMPEGLGGFLNAVVLAFFAYLGFEVVANTAEELREPRKNLPRAILISVAVCAVLYVLVAQAYTALLPYEQAIRVVQEGKGPLAVAAASVAGPIIFTLLAAIALFSTANTVLVSLFGASRMQYGMARQKALPAWFSAINAYGLPHWAVAASTLAAIALTSLGDLELLGEASVAGMLAVFALDNVALIRIRLSEKRPSEGFRVPLNVANLPLPAILSALACVGLILYQAASSPTSVAIAAGLGLVGIGFYIIQPRQTQPLNM